jgi:hypothetical protein
MDLPVIQVVTLASFAAHGRVIPKIVRNVLEFDVVETVIMFGHDGIVRSNAVERQRAHCQQGRGQS